MSALTSFFSIRGRIARGRFWLIGAFFTATVLLIGVAGVGVVHAFGMQSASLDLGLITFAFGRTGPSIDISPWLALPFVPTAIKRLHDRDRSGWRLVVFALVQLAVLLVATVEDAIKEGRATVTMTPPLSPAGEAVAAWLVANAPLASAAVAAWCFVELACLSGTVGTNRYGRDPISPTWSARDRVAQPTST